MNSETASDYALVKRTLGFISENWREQPSLDVISEQAGLSPHHLQRHPGGPFLEGQSFEGEEMTLHDRVRASAGERDEDGSHRL